MLKHPIIQKFKREKSLMNTPSLTKIKIIGVGGAGGNAINRISTDDPNIEIIGFNTDVQALGQIKNPVRTFAIGPDCTSGMGSGGDPITGNRAIKESREQVEDLLKDTDLLFVVSGLGGGTGTGASPSIAEIGRKQGALVVAVMTLPFTFEGDFRYKNALNGLDAVSRKAHTTVVIENDQLLQNQSFTNKLEHAFLKADEVLQSGVQSISEIITLPGLINVDFADVKSILMKGGFSYMSTGKGKGKDAAKNALANVLSQNSTETPIKNAEGLLVNIKGGDDLTLEQIQLITSSLKQNVNPQARIILGVVQSKKLKKSVEISILATQIQPNFGIAAKEKTINLNELIGVTPIPIPIPSNNSILNTNN